MPQIKIQRTEDFSENMADVVFLIFTATWCRPCSNLKEYLKDKVDKNNIMFAIVDVDNEDCKDLVDKYEVTSISRTIVFKNNFKVDDIKGFNSVQYEELLFKYN